MSIEEDVRAIATMEGRETGTPGHTKAREYIVRRLREIGIEPYFSTGFQCEYAIDGLRFSNVVGLAPGADDSASPILLGAHYDTCGPFPGADDNAAAVGVLLDVAERAIRQPIERPLVFAFFDAEEPPHFLSPSMGSVRFYEDQRRGNFHCAIIMDLVGHDVSIPGLEDVLFIMGMESDADLGEVITNCPEDPSVRVMPTLSRYVGDMSDHHVFRVNEVPYLFLSCGTWPNYHQATDTAEKLNYHKIGGVSRYLTELTRSISGKWLSGPFEGYDSTDIELAYIDKVLRPVMARMGIPFKATGRQDIDKLVAMLVAYIG